MVKKGITITFNECGCIIKDANQRFITVATKVRSLYHMMYAESKDHVYTVTKKLHEDNHLLKEDLWHCQYGHLGVKNLKCWLEIRIMFTLLLRNYMKIIIY